jgi:hypothetical protein
LEHVKRRVFRMSKKKKKTGEFLEWDRLEESGFREMNVVFTTEESAREIADKHSGEFITKVTYSNVYNGYLVWRKFRK